MHAKPDMWMPDPSTTRFNLMSVFGGRLAAPASYIVFDLETTNPDPATAVIWQIGYYVMTRGEPAYDKGRSLYVWQPESVLNQAVFEIERRAALLAAASGKPEAGPEEQNRARAKFIDEVQTNGVDAHTALAAMSEILRAHIAAGYPLVGQNCVRFDMPVFDWGCRRNKLPKFEFPRHNVIDTGALIKAGKTKMRIMYGESPAAFYARVCERRVRGCYYSLDRWAIPAYGMQAKYGVDANKAHDAGYDCYLTSLLMHELIETAKEAECV